ncbi:hypothetical protein N9Y42_07840 [Mariniblastus sp.]|nr:hypothetical protein [Mariniblastus sp.]
MDQESENRLGIAKRAEASKHAFDWPDDPLDLPPSVDFKSKNISHTHRLNWALFWLVAWSGTTAAGTLFGGMLGLYGAMQDPTALLSGLLFGAVWSGLTGLFVFVHLAAICWMFWWLGRPLVIASIAGLLTGAICGVVIFSLITAPLGALGAYLASKLFLKSTTGAKFLATIEAVQDQSLGPLRFTMMDMLLRVTVLAVFLAGWTAWLQSF